MKVDFPSYDIDFPEGIMETCFDMAPRLLNEIGFKVGNERFLSAVEGKAACRIDGGRIYFDEALTREYMEKCIAQARRKFTEKPKEKSSVQDEWRVQTAGFSMLTIDVETEELREATCVDLRNMIKLTNSFDVGGSYMVMPQELPPLMRALACFKICWEMSDNIKPYDYQHPSQLPFLYEMHKVVEKPMDICFSITSTLTVDEKDLDIFLDYYPEWKSNRDINFRVLNYPMTAITKPITVTGCATLCFTESLAMHMILNLFDPEIELPLAFEGGIPTDMRNVCWAFGSPRTHLFDYLSSRILPNLLKIDEASYSNKKLCRLATTSAGIDEQAAMEKMATGLVAALQGARSFTYAGVLCTDDIYSGTQFVIDLEIVKYIRELVESFSPHPDIVNTEGLYDEIKSVALGDSEFISHENTAMRFRNILPSSELIIREKARSWLRHKKYLKDHAKEEAIEKIRSFEPQFELPEDKQRALDGIYEKAKKELS